MNSYVSNSSPIFLMAAFLLLRIVYSFLKLMLTPLYSLSFITLQLSSLQFFFCVCHQDDVICASYTVSVYIKSWQNLQLSYDRLKDYKVSIFMVIQNLKVLPKAFIYLSYRTATIFTVAVRKKRVICEEAFRIDKRIIICFTLFSPLKNQ